MTNDRKDLLARVDRIEKAIADDDAAVRNNEAADDRAAAIAALARLRQRVETEA